MFEAHLFGNHPSSWTEYEMAIRATLEAMRTSLPGTSYGGQEAAELAKILPQLRDQGGDWASALKELKQIIAGSVAVYHPHTCAHLQCPVLIASLCAELVLTALNPSLDSFDQSAAATLIEQQVCEWVGRLVGFERDSGATFTTGGTQSNYLGLLLARDHYVQRQWGWSVHSDGLPAKAAGRLKIICSDAAHFSVVKSAHQLGLGTSAVIKVPTDSHAQMNPVALQETLQDLRAKEQAPFVVIATAGTTDAGAVDPLERISALCQQHRLWLHVDAAWGGSLLLSKRHRHKLVGLPAADSVSLDFHKGFYQPLSCSALVVRRAASLELIRHHADYLNPESHEELGVPDLVTHSLLTSRRFDSLKLWLTLRIVGVPVLEAMVDRTLALAAEVAWILEQSTTFELVCPPHLSSILFRVRPMTYESPAQLEALHREIPKRLLHAGLGIIGFSKWRGQQILKLTLLNPRLETKDLVTLMAHIATVAGQIRAAYEPAFSEADVNC